MNKNDFNSSLGYMVTYEKKIKIEKNCNVDEFDLIHAHTIFPSGIAAYLLAKKYDKPFLITSHGFDFYRILPKTDPDHRGNSYNIKEKQLIRDAMEKVTQFICVSEIFGNHVKSYFPKINLKIVPNVYDKELFNKFGRKAHKSSKSCTILTVGNFIPVKNHEMLMRAYNKINGEFPDVKLQIIGKGVLKKYYKKLCEELSIQENVQIIDQADHSEIADFMKNADIYVQTSLSETFGMTIVEAMACGLPVISTRTQGPSTYIENEKTGFLVDKNDVTSLAENLIKLIRNPELRNDIGANAAESVKAKFSNYTKLVSLYKKIGNYYSE
ncbi:MAG: glycosyltransferase family 4 protein [Candidatus Cloacimonetes bacterium]|nr:glycosyltransferase family 4 protein [Candidatus Cloacimonadota bacterium]